MKLDSSSVQKTLESAEKLGLIAAGEVGDVLAAFEPSYPFRSAVELAQTMHAHVKVDAVHALPHDRLRASGGVVENEKDGYVKYTFPSGMNLIFSSISVSEDDLREASQPVESRRARPYLDHYGVDVREESADAKAVFDALPRRATELGLPSVPQGGAGERVFCCHTSVAAKHWVFPNAGGRKHPPPSIEFALGALTIQAGKSGCDLRPTNPALGLEPVHCGAGGAAVEGHYYEKADLGRFGTIADNAKPLGEKFFAWYTAVFEDGALSAREKSIIALAVAHAVQCPYCIDAYSHDATSKGFTLDQLTEAVHVAAAIRGGAALVHGVQMRGHVHANVDH